MLKELQVGNSKIDQDEADVNPEFVIGTPEWSARYLTDALNHSAAAFLRSLRHVAREQYADRTMEDWANDTEIAAPYLYRLTSGIVDPRLSTVIRILETMKLKLAVVPE